MAVVISGRVHAVSLPSISLSPDAKSAQTKLQAFTLSPYLNQTKDGIKLEDMFRAALDLVGDVMSLAHLANNDYCYAVGVMLNTVFVPDEQKFGKLGGSLCEIALTYLPIEESEAFRLLDHYMTLEDSAIEKSLQQAFLERIGHFKQKYGADKLHTEFLANVKAIGRSRDLKQSGLFAALVRDYPATSILWINELVSQELKPGAITATEIEFLTDLSNEEFGLGIPTTDTQRICKMIESFGARPEWSLQLASLALMQKIGCTAHVAQLDSISKTDSKVVEYWLSRIQKRPFICRHCSSGE